MVSLSVLFFRHGARGHVLLRMTRNQSLKAAAALLNGKTTSCWVSVLSATSVVVCLYGCNVSLWSIHGQQRRHFTDAGLVRYIAYAVK